MTTSLLLLLQQQLQQLVQLNELLHLERDALAGRSPAEVEQVTQQKNDALNQLQTIDNQIKHNFSDADFSDEAVLQAKADIEQALTELKQLNDVNGKILQQKQISNSQLKEMIIGSRKDKTATTYDQLGQKTNTLKGKAIKA